MELFCYIMIWQVLQDPQLDLSWDRDVPREIPIPSHLYGFKTFPSRGIPIWEFPRISRVSRISRPAEVSRIPILWEIPIFWVHLYWIFNQFFALKTLSYEIFNHLYYVFCFEILIVAVALRISTNDSSVITVRISGYRWTTQVDVIALVINHSSCMGQVQTK